MQMILLISNVSKTPMHWIIVMIMFRKDLLIIKKVKVENCEKYFLDENNRRMFLCSTKHWPSKSLANSLEYILTVASDSVNTINFLLEEFTRFADWIYRLRQCTKESGRQCITALSLYLQIFMVWLHTGTNLEQTKTSGRQFLWATFFRKKKHSLANTLAMNNCLTVFELYLIKFIQRS